MHCSCALLSPRRWGIRRNSRGPGENTTARQTWPSPQRHQTFLWLPVVTISGVSEPFKSCAHWAATLGCCVARSLNPGSTRRPVQYGQPVPPVLRDDTAA